MRRTRAAALAAFSSIALAACGGSSHDGETVDDPPAAAAGSATAFHGDAAHAGASASAVATFASAPAWSRTFPGAVSHAVVAGSQVYLISSDLNAPFSKRLHALDVATGADLRAPTVLVTDFGANLAAGPSRVYVATFEGLVIAYDTATGTQAWSVKLPRSYGFTSAPIAAADRVYVNNGGDGTTVSLDAATGAVVWSKSLSLGGSAAPPAFADGRVYMSSPCHAYSLQADTGAEAWAQNGPCSGGGGETVAAANGRVYVRDLFRADATFEPNIVVRDAAGGTELGRLSSSDGFVPTVPAVTASAAYVLSAATLRRFDLLLRTVQWSFAGDGGLITSPLVIDRYVVVASSTGRVFAVDAVTGTPVWSTPAAEPIVDRDEGNVVLRGLAFGAGHLLVPAGSTLTAWRLSATP